jgi:tripartite-type tricarboxylate transporter receptor subunit TctC
MTARAFIRLAWLAAALFGTAASAQDYPSKPIRIIVGYTTGGGNDLIARLIGPKMAEGLGQPVGVPDVEAGFWMALFVPAATPPAIVKRLNDEVVKAVRMPEVRERLVALGVDPVGSPPEALTRVLTRDLEKWTAVAKAANIKSD